MAAAAGACMMFVRRTGGKLGDLRIVQRRAGDSCNATPATSTGSDSFTFMLKSPAYTYASSPAKRAICEDGGKSSCGEWRGAGSYYQQSLELSRGAMGSVERRRDKAMQPSSKPYSI